MAVGDKTLSYFSCIKEIRAESSESRTVPDYSRPKYDQVSVRKFDHITYAAAIQRYTAEIKAFEQSIIGYISPDRVVDGLYVEEQFIPNNDAERNYEQLYIKWQKAEFASYFLVKVGNSLEELGIVKIMQRIVQ